MRRAFHMLLLSCLVAFTPRASISQVVNQPFDDGVVRSPDVSFGGIAEWRTLKSEGSDLSRSEIITALRQQGWDAEALLSRFGDEPLHVFERNPSPGVREFLLVSTTDEGTAIQLSPTMLTPFVSDFFVLGGDYTTVEMAENGKLERLVKTVIERLGEGAEIVCSANTIPDEISMSGAVFGVGINLRWSVEKLCDVQ